MARYGYHVVEGSFVVRMRGGRAERLTAEGGWVDYPDTWDVVTNGRWVKGGEAAALAAAKEIFDGRRRGDAAERAVAAYRARGPGRAAEELLDPEFATPAAGSVFDGSAHVSIRSCQPAVPDGVDAVEARTSPDGRRVAVAWGGPGGAGIDVGRVGGEGDWQPLMRMGGEKPAELAWSPEGSHVAYRISGRSAIQDQVAWIDTATPMRERGRVEGTVFAWGAGDRGLYVGYGPCTEIAWHDVTTGERRPLVHYHTYLPREFRARIVLSPLGNRLAFTTREVRDDASWVYVFDLETEELRVVTRISGAEAHVLPCWAPDGDALALHVVHGPCGRTGVLVHVLSDATEELLYVSEGVGDAGSPAWSPDGRFIVFFVGDSLHRLEVEAGSLTRLCEPGRVSGDLHFIDENRLAVDGGPAVHTLTIGRVR